MELEFLRYPIGRFKTGVNYTPKQTDDHIQVIRTFPDQLAHLLNNWEEWQLDTPYRPGGWTVRQLVHHLADSHMNAYVRCRLALTEDRPSIKPYEEQLWAELPDARSAPVDLSIQLLKYIHIRWILLLSSLSASDLARTYYHPASQLEFSLKEVIANYAWHSEHHYQHAFQLAERNKWR